MSGRDRRLTPCNGRVAAEHLRGAVDAATFVVPDRAKVCAPVADLWREPGGVRDRQILFGDQVDVFEERAGFAFVQSIKDGYVGYVAQGCLGPVGADPTHWVAVQSSHAYPEPDMKVPEAYVLPFCAHVTVVSHLPGFFETDGGLYIPKPHLRPVDKRFKDPVTAAQLLFGAPYLWGGNTSAGVDCSGLVQLAWHAAGRDCPADSDMQETLGEIVEPKAQMQRGDLLFWRGHVALAVDDATLIHANVHHMAVAYEPAEKAIRRIEAQGDGPVIGHRR
ncbi:MAG: C40 family peptidase, partial [Pseudomonadota bacterium]